MGIKGVQNIILVLSGKGGVGKSSVSAHLALSLRDLNFKVGLLDLDLCGPSIPYLIGIEDKDVHQDSEGWLPVFTDESQTLGVMSIGFLLNSRNDAVIWRGPKKNAMIKQFLNDVSWEALDYLVIDMPPGTTDEHITLAENLKNESNVGAVLVTTPQVGWLVDSTVIFCTEGLNKPGPPFKDIGFRTEEDMKYSMIAINDVMREITFCKKASLQIIGIIENMSGYVCPNCKECSAIFSQGGGESLAKSSNLQFLGKIPIDPQFAASIKDRSAKKEIDYTDSLKIFQEISHSIVNKMKIND